MPQHMQTAGIRQIVLQRLEQMGGYVVFCTQGLLQGVPDFGLRILYPGQHVRRKQGRVRVIVPRRALYIALSKKCELNGFLKTALRVHGGHGSSSAGVKTLLKGRNIAHVNFSGHRMSNKGCPILTQEFNRFFQVFPLAVHGRALGVEVIGYGLLFGEGGRR